MPLEGLAAYEPRKTPVQARSTVTVEAISEATIQVLLNHGAERLTTTRVAERAGVSVGTLYQYYPNKQSMLFAVLENHLNNVAARVEAACESACHKPLAEMIKEMVEAFVDAKMERADISVALYRIAVGVGGPTLIKQINQRLRKTAEAMLETAPNVKSPPDKFAIEIMLSAMAGAMRSLLEAGPTPATVHKAREQLVLLCQSYMTATTAKRI
ncbi:MAG TPA: TetR/AcrR family transcriptional regulator [Pseudacidobacterium sp.]|jgi:AcrR family transcriptional regulator|nr:TetR/AcrR family transcriptional regulator [Pseudacidobacterium sp.]